MEQEGISYNNYLPFLTVKKYFISQFPNSKISLKKLLWIPTLICF